MNDEYLYYLAFSLAVSGSAIGAYSDQSIMYGNTSSAYKLAKLIAPILSFILLVGGFFLFDWTKPFIAIGITMVAILPLNALAVRGYSAGVTIICTLAAVASSIVLALT